MPYFPSYDSSNLFSVDVFVSIRSLLSVLLAFFPLNCVCEIYVELQEKVDDRCFNLPAQLLLLSVFNFFPQYFFVSASVW